MNRTLALALLVLAAGSAHAQMTRKAPMNNSTRQLLGGPTQVNVMPGYPNSPHTDPAERRQVRPGVPVLVWGNANQGNGTAVGATYTWSFSPNPNVMVTTDGSLTGPVTDDKYIFEEVTFTLLFGSTAENITATLTVDDAGDIDSDAVEIRIIDPTDPSSTAPLDNLQIDVNIAIQEGLRFLYLSQATDGGWGIFDRCGVTSFHLWAIENQGHLRANDPTEDILSKTVADGLDFLFLGAVAGPIFAANADVARGAIAAGVSDMNANGRSIDICPVEAMYSRAVAGAAVAASVDSAQIIGVGPFAGETYLTFLEDAIDFYGTVQNTGGLIGPRGGWDYAGPSARSDMSINSWIYVAMEGGQTVFGIDVPDWIIQESEYALVFHQMNIAGPTPFGYSSPFRLAGPMHGQATTGGGLSGLALNELAGPQVLPGAIIGTAGPPLDTIMAKRTAALDYLGSVWSVDSNGDLGNGNRGNYYAMWTVTRALRLTAIALGLPAGDLVELTNGGIDFDWETGETLNPDLGNVPPSGDPREGYFHWLVVEQDTVSGPLTRGRWDSNTYLETFGYGESFETAMAILILTPRVFLSSCPEYDAPTPADGSTLMVSAEQPISFDVVASDLNVGDTVTLTAIGLPPGATFATVPGNPATGTFSWTPTVPQIGVYNILFEASDGTMQCPPTPLRVNIEVSECFALVAGGVGSDTYTVGHTFQTQLSGIVDSQPVLMDDPGTLTVTLPAPPQGGPAGAQARSEWNGTVVAEYFVEVVMWNPVVFPQNPEQHTPGLHVRVFDNGHVTAETFGTGDNMEFLPVQHTLQPNGTVELTFPFVIHGI